MGSDEATRAALTHPAAGPLLDSSIIKMLFKKICMIYNTIHLLIPIWMYNYLLNNDKDFTYFTFESFSE